MNILITGAFGFIGTNLSKSLGSSVNRRLIALDLQETVSHVYNAFYSWSELSKIDWKNIDVVIHLAGKAHDTKNYADEMVYFDVNVGLTEKIFKHFLNSGASKFIFFSSVKAVADHVNGEFLTEHDNPVPETPYGKSKLEAERFLTSFEMTEKKQIYILRPCMVHGPGNKGNLNLLYKLVCKGIPWPLGAFKNRRSFTSIDNLAFIIRQILVKDITPGIYQIADDYPISTNRLIELMAASKNKKAKILLINRSVISLVARFGGLLHLALNPERLKKLTESYVVSNKKLKQALGITTMPVSAEEGLRKTLNSFK